MSDDNQQTKPGPSEFDFSAYPSDTLFHDRRTGADRRARESAPEPIADEGPPPAPAERRQKKERRRRIDPTTFDKQYTDEELEFMNAMQRFKEQTGKAFPSHAEVLLVAAQLGYRRVLADGPFQCDVVGDDPAPLGEPGGAES